MKLPNDKIYNTIPLMEKNTRSAYQPVPSDDPEQQGYRQTINNMLKRAARWDAACRAARYVEPTSVGNRATTWNGAFDVVRQEEATRKGTANNGAANSPNTDTYRMLVNIVDDNISGSSRMYTFQHLTGKPFLLDPLTGENVQSLQLHVQEFRHSEEASNFHLEVAEQTTQGIHRAVVFTVEQGDLYVSAQFRGDTFLENEHAERLVDFLDGQMPEDGTNLPSPDSTRQLS